MTVRSGAAGGGSSLIEAYDAALLDLDGVVYLGSVAVDGAPEAITRLHDRGVKIGYVTNNAARPPGAVAEHLRELGIPAQETDVVTAAQAAAHVLVNRFGSGAKILVVGGEGLLAALAERDLTPVRSAEDDPVAVVQGWAFDLTWDQLNEAAVAIHRGAFWLATNTDATRPTERGLVPGNGAAVAAVSMAVGVLPEVAGKPYRPLLDETIERLGASRPIFVGDRLDTDIAGARAAGVDSMLVLTGSHRGRDLMTAGPESRPTHLGCDLAALDEAPLAIVDEGEWIRSGSVRAREREARVVLEGTLADGEFLSGRRAAEALWAAARVNWQARDAGRELDVNAVLQVVGDLA